MSIEKITTLYLQFQVGPPDHARSPMSFAIWFEVMPVAPCTAGSPKFFRKYGYPGAIFSLLMTERN
jgi:hypothetical protein